MKKFLMMIGFVAIAAMTACGAGGDDVPVEDDTPVDEAPAADEAATGDFDATAAEDIYNRSCIGCHGQNLQGGGSGPGLIDSGLSVEEIVHVLEQGQGLMPPQDLEPDEAENLAKWILAQ
ncbi:c-type cytochrome [Halalkalibacter hemicellulosilyticus]|uniref:Cytochrome c551 n=1 Tax=Halalkalibacter hemicellulosilyticusJCM 9152 TaxID=1236971 RepID=W4QI47_9BACI|nr:cytochrome c [Halalkalibacter hemicellulosilyticus]GAE31567.1 cytochrome c551 [Halalkalibacter hemicellulosilyticusJCM 9152]